MRVGEGLAESELARGGDRRGFARIRAAWAEQNGIQQVRFGLDRKLGDRAGFRRNEQMLSLKPRYVIAFQGNGVTERLVIDAKKAGIVDNDWIEAFNTNGALVARAVVSQRVKQGMCLMYHAQEQIVNVPG